MAVKSNVQAVTQRIISALRDANNDSWPETTVHDVILEAEKVVVIHRPDAAPVDHEFACTAGIKQDISTLTNPPPHRLLEVKYNTDGSGGPGRGIRRVGLGDKDASDPMWRTKTSSTTIKEFMFDPREPMLFYVDPPAAAGAHLQICYSAIPADYGTVDANTVTTVSSIYEPALIDWALYRLFGHDVEGSVNVTRSQQHLQNFERILGIKLQAEQFTSLKNLEHKS